MGPWYECLEITGATGPRSRDGIVRFRRGVEGGKRGVGAAGVVVVLIVLLFYLPGGGGAFPEIKSKKNKR